MPHKLKSLFCPNSYLAQIHITIYVYVFQVIFIGFYDFFYFFYIFLAKSNKNLTATANLHSHAHAICNEIKYKHIINNTCRLRNGVLLGSECSPT